MNNTDRESYARRSRKYRDRSNFGSAEDGYSIGQSEPPEQEQYGDRGVRQEQYAPQEDDAPTRQKQYGMKENNVIEEYDPDDLVEYDEFGRRRRRRMSRREKPQKKGREAWGWVISIALAVVAALLIRSYVFEIILVDGESMYPTLYTNERVAIEKVTRYGGMPERGDIIIVEYPGMTGTYVKRAIGLPGETVEVKDSTVYINGQPLAEDYVNREAYADMEAMVVPEDHVFVMGDNRAHSLDSRTGYIGPIAHDAIIGHALFVIWPLNNIHGIS